MDLRNADAVEVVVNDGSSVALTFNNVGGTLTDIAVNNTSSNTTINLAAAANLTEINLNVSNVMATETYGGANISIPTAETININSHTLASSIDLIATSANTITIGGDADLTVGSLNAAGTTGVESIDASLFEGDLNITLGQQSQVLSTTDITVNSGLGNDFVVMTGVLQDYTVTLGAGDDILVDTGIGRYDSVEGGEGTDTLSTTWGNAITLAATTNGVNGIDALSVNALTTASLTVANVDSTIDTLSVAVVGSAGALSTGAGTIVGGAGEFTVNLGGAAASNAASLSDTLAITDTGTATTDTLNLNNLAVNSSTNTSVNVFSDGASSSASAEDVTINGYENVVLNTGSASPTAQTIGTLTINVDTINGLASSAASLTVEGSSPLTIDTSLTTNSTGLLTVDASGLNVLSTANGLRIDAISQGVGGTASIVGSVGADTVVTGNFASTVYGGTGNDVLTGGTAADQLHGEDGNDSLTGSGGNDTIHGGAGNDTITETVAGSASITGGDGNDSVSVGAVLSSGDVVDGGAGVDTLSVTAAITGTTGVGVSNFEVLRTTADQVMTNTINNNSWTTVQAIADGVDITNALAAVTTLQVDQAAGSVSGTTSTITAMSFGRLVDTATDSLTVAASNYLAGASGNTPYDIVLSTLTANDEESITIDVSNGASTVDGDLTITTLNAADLTTLTATGDHNVATTLAGSTGLTTLTNSLTGTATFNVNAGVSTSNLTFVSNGGSTGNSSVTGGSGNDTITASLAAAINAVGGLGNDTITGGNLNDSIDGGTGSDSLLGGAGNDTITGGQGADIVNGGTGVDTFSAADLNNVADGGTASSTGVVINLGSTTLTAAAIFSASASYTANGNTSVAAGGVAYLDDQSSGAGLSTNQDSLSNIQNVIGSAGNDYIVGSSVANTIEGGAGNDVINGGAGFDTIDVGAGANTVVLGAATDTTYSTTVFASPITTGGTDVLVSMTTNDVINLSALSIGVSSGSIGTSLSTVLTSDALNLVRGSYDVTTGVFTSGTASADNDWFLQIVESTGTAYNAGMVLLDVGTTLTGTWDSSAETITLS